MLNPFRRYPHEGANPEAFLVTIVTRLRLDRLKSAKAQREVYVGPGCPSRVRRRRPSAKAATELADDLSFALLLALDRLSPMERAASCFTTCSTRRFPRSPPCSTAPRRPAGNWPRGPAARCATNAGPAATPDSHARLLQAFGEAVTSAMSRVWPNCWRGCGGANRWRRPQDGGPQSDHRRRKDCRFFIGLAAKTAGPKSASSLP